MNDRARALSLSVLAVAVNAASLSCGSGDGGTTDPSSARVMSVFVSPTAVQLGVFGAAQVTAEPRNAVNELLTGRAITWTSESAAIATVSAEGVITGRGDGTTRVTATSEGRTGIVDVTVVPFIELAAITTGGEHTCGLTLEGAAYCWGTNSFGQLGDGTTQGRQAPVAVVGGSRFVSITAGQSHTCATIGSGAALCWGDDRSSQLGDGDSTSTSRSQPTPVIGGLEFVQLSAGSQHTCGVTANGTSYCWGSDSWGQLGDGPPSVNWNAPSAVAGGVAFDAVSAGGTHSCGVSAGGVAHCWGNDSYGALGDSTGGNFRPQPVAVTTDLRFRSVIAGGDRTCGVTTADLAYCWGENGNGQLGDGTRLNKALPTAVSGLRNFGALDVGGGQTCALTPGGDVWCWGMNSYGELGNGQTLLSTLPVPVTGGTGFKAIAAGRIHSCAVRTVGGVYCWGDGLNGALGEGFISNRRTTMVRVRSP